MTEYRLTLTDPSLTCDESKIVNLRINGTEVQAPRGLNIVEVARRMGIDIPYFCYHPRLSKGGAANCRMCLVEVSSKAPDGSIRKMPKPQAACTLPADEGMIIETETEALKKDRRGILEFLLINHPLDCPICDRGGECPLQNNTLFYGASATRFIEEKRHFHKAVPLAEHVVFDRERCIHCARCTRFTEDISGDGQLAFLKRSADMEVGVVSGSTYTSRFSGNVIELCPVGALLSRDYRFKARPWDLLTQASICSRCSNGCNIKFDYRVNEIQRVNARVNEAVNEEWTCDRGKFGHDHLTGPDRLKTPLMRQNGELGPVSWQVAFDALTERLKAAGPRAGAIGGSHLTNEDAFVFQRLFREAVGSPNVDSRLGRWQGSGAAPLLKRLGYPAMGTSIAGMERMRSIFVIGGDLADEQPILFLRVRKAWRFGAASVISAAPEREGADPALDFAEIGLRYREGSALALLGGLLNAIFAAGLAAPNAGHLRAEAEGWPVERAASATGLPAEAFARAARAITQSTCAFIAGDAIRDSRDFAVLASALASLAEATGNGGNVNIPVGQVNAQGAADVGMLPDCLPGYQPAPQNGLTTHGMLEAARDGGLDLLWVAGEDLAARYHDRDLASQALETCPFVVVSELFLTQTAAQADLVIPVSSPAEKDGTFTNCEGRVQRLRSCFSLSPDLRSDWVVFAQAAGRLGTPFEYISTGDVLKGIAASAPMFADLSMPEIDAGGQLLRYNRPGSN
ncbi:MAG: NADH-quinone oxidoreductase subunit NuoG [Armatimonadetes bacterium]|nr:NADH-quinone oxidoreductase subunit NuoG [Armatimonadota bacterium]MDE2206724.1 NADH-quinone oxidoreductase subunit NuoG [Armatimonadota bacterium]